MAPFILNKSWYISFFFMATDVSKCTSFYPEWVLASGGQRIPFCQAYHGYFLHPEEVVAGPFDDQLAWPVSGPHSSTRSQ